MKHLVLADFSLTRGDRFSAIWSAALFCSSFSLVHSLVSCRGPAWQQIAADPSTAAILGSVALQPAGIGCMSVCRLSFWPSQIVFKQQLEWFADEPSGQPILNLLCVWVNCFNILSFICIQWNQDKQINSNSGLWLKEELPFEHFS